MFSDEKPNLIVDPDDIIYYRCPVVDNNGFIRQWVKESEIPGVWYDGVFYFQNKEDRNIARILL